jgi:hypothetical protein
VLADFEQQFISALAIESAVGQHCKTRHGTITNKTKMKRLIIVFILLLFCIENSFSINNYKAGDTLYVWAPNGVTLRTEKSEYSDKIIAIKYGEKIVTMEPREIYENPESSVLEIDLNKNNRIDDNDFSLNGLWVKVQFGNIIGYIFDGYLSKLIPMNSTESFIEYTDRSFNKLKVFKNFKEDYRIQYHVIYDNGIMLDQEDNISSFNCGIRTYFLPLSVEETYLIFYAKFLSRYPEFASSYKKIDSETFKCEFELGGITISNYYNYVAVSEWYGN